MADISDSGLSKSQKKNLQRKAKKHPDAATSHVDPIADLREQLAEAKENKSKEDYLHWRGHNLQIKKQRPRLEIRKYSFTHRVVDMWNQLPKSAAYASSINAFNKSSNTSKKKDHALANQLRQQLWIAQDLAAGYKPKIDEEDAKGRALLKQVQDTTPSQMSSKPSATTTVTTVSVVGNPDDEKKLKSLKKKLAQIEALKKRRDEGEKLEKNQLKKIETEDELKEEIEHYEQLISLPLKR